VKVVINPSTTAKRCISAISVPPDYASHAVVLEVLLSVRSVKKR